MEEWQDVHRRWQDETMDYRDALRALAESSGGFSAAEIRHHSHEYILYGVGQPSEALAAMMRQAPANVKVSWVETPHSKEELTAEVLRILSEQNGRLNGGGPLIDGTGISFLTTDSDLLEASDPTAMLGAHYPVVMEYGGRAIWANG